MIKQILLLFSLLGYFVSKLWIGDIVSVNQEIPSKVISGSEFIIKVSIDKGDLNEYANYSLKLPRGLSAEQIEPIAGIFTFKDQYVTISWPQLPASKNFNFRYKIKVNPHFKGDASLAAVFSFIHKNKREQLQFSENVIQINSKKEEIENVVQCERTAPSAVAPGDIFTVTLKVNKGDISGFAKIQELLPAGFEAEAMETQNAIFSFSDQKVKYLWMSLTTEPEFSISYKVKVGDNVSGTFKIEGSFFYVVNNETIKQEIASSTIVVTNEELNNEVTFKGQEEMPLVNKEETITEETTTSTKTEQQLSTTQQEQANAEAQKKAQEEQDRMEAQKKAQEEAQAKVEAEKKAQEEQSQKLAAEQAAKQQEENRLKQEAEAQKAAAEEAAQKAEEEKKMQADAEAKKAAEVEAATKAKEQEEQRKQQTTTEQASVSKSTSSNLLSNTASPSEGVNYRVQIAAIKTSVDDHYFKRRYKVEEEIFYETHEGWNKYTVGGFNTYSDAKTKRTSVNETYGIKGPFVTAYNQGKRITVQEALMISNQKWVQ